MTYIIYSLPRSRTYWVSRFLTYADWHCSHDELMHARSMQDVEAWLSMPNNGSVETLAPPFWRLVKDVKTVVIRRPVDDVIDSLKRLGLTVDRRTIERYDRKLDQIARRVPCLSIQFEDLDDEETCKTLFEYCLPYPHDHNWWTLLAGMNLQIDFAQMLRYYQAYQPQLDKLAKIAKHKCLAAMSSEPIVEIEGMTIQQEPFMQAYMDGQKMYADHCVLVGEAPDSYQYKNLALMQQLDETGHLQVTTARCNGRLFGYLVATISPSLESPETTAGIHTMFFCDPSVKGLGMKLQRASVEALRERGVDEIYFHAGVRGSGPRLGTIYKRLGAEQFGSVYKLSLTNK